MRSLSCGERAILNQDNEDFPKPDIRVLRKARHVSRCDRACDGCDGEGFIAKGEPYTVTVMLTEGEFESRRRCARPSGCNAPPYPKSLAPPPLSEAERKAIAENPWGPF